MALGRVHLIEAAAFEQTQEEGLGYLTTVILKATFTPEEMEDRLPVSRA